MTTPILRVENLSIDYVSRFSGVIHAVSNVSLELNEGEVLGVVGESGSGKSTLALAVARLLDERNAVYKQGKIDFSGVDMISASEPVVRRLRGTGIFMVFQDPFMSLNPLMQVKDQLLEAISERSKLRNESLRKSEALSQAVESLRAVRIGDAQDVARRYPHELSGGQNQRVMLAMALCEKPKLLIADEPTTALDVTTQAQVLNLITEIVSTANMSVMLITHDLAIAGSICERLVVMYGGMIQEIGSTKLILRDPKHPYTLGLIKSIPNKSKHDGRLDVISGSFSELALREKYQECSFSSRCPFVRDVCRKSVPALFNSDGRLVRCFNYGEEHEN